MGRHIHSAWLDGRFVFICGNGGSASIASQMVVDIVKGASLRKAARFKMIGLTDSIATITAYANDEGYETVFEEPLRNFARPGDLVMGISGSGNSPNILRAVEWATDHDMTTWGVTGFDGGQLQQMAGHNLHVASTDMGLVESVHLVAFHWILDDVYARINQVGRYESSGIRRAA